MYYIYLTLSWIPFAPGVHSKICTYLNRFGTFKTFSCVDTQRCCRNECCGTMYEFYRLWYFWLASFLLLVLIGGLSYVAWRRWIKQQTTCRYPSAPTHHRLILDDTITVQDHCFVPVSPPPYKCSPPSYSSQDSLDSPPPYEEKPRKHPQ